VPLSLQITHEVFFPQSNFFLAVILQLPIPKIRFNSIPLFPSSYLGKLASKLDSVPVEAEAEVEVEFLSTKFFFIATLQDNAENTDSLLLEVVCTATLHSNGSYSIVACLFVSAGISLPSRCLAMNIYSEFTIPALGRHVRIGRAMFYRVSVRPAVGLQDDHLLCELVS
jgi:hypothetical protein